MRILIALGVAIASSVVGCADVDANEEGGAAAEGGDGKADGEGTCETPEYGDGTCQLDLACGIPDIDCYRVFADDAEAAASYRSEARTSLVTPTDPRFVRMRALLDRAWPVFTAHARLGRLADARPALVLLEDGYPQAFITAEPSTGRGRLALFVHTGVIRDDVTDDAILWLVFHELQHLAGQHWFGEVFDRTRRFYFAPDGSEPIGADQPVGGATHEAVAAWWNDWVVAARGPGRYADAALGGLPQGGTFGDVYAYLLRRPSAACTALAQSALQALARIQISNLDQSLLVPTAQLDTAREAIGAFRACEVVPLATVLTQRDEYLGLRPDWSERPEWATYPASLFAEPAAGRIEDFIREHRTTLREVEAELEPRFGRPKHAVRYYSTEEQADDVAVAMSRAAGVDVAAASRLLLVFVGPEAATCEAWIRDGKPIPYGNALDDPHHGSCWRYAHAQQIAARTPGRRAVRRDAAPPATTIPTRVIREPID